MCHIKFILVCVYPLVSVTRLATGVLFNVLHPLRMETDDSDESILLVFYLFQQLCILLF